MILHRPHVFHRKESRTEALRASLALLDAQRLMFEGQPSTTWKKYVRRFTRTFVDRIHLPTEAHQQFRTILRRIRRHHPHLFDMHLLPAGAPAAPAHLGPAFAVGAIERFATMQSAESSGQVCRHCAARRL